MVASVTTSANANARRPRSTVERLAASDENEKARVFRSLLSDDGSDCLLHSVKLFKQLDENSKQVMMQTMLAMFGGEEIDGICASRQKQKRRFFEPAFLFDLHKINSLLF